MYDLEGLNYFDRPREPVMGNKEDDLKLTTKCLGASYPIWIHNVESRKRIDKSSKHGTVCSTM